MYVLKVEDIYTDYFDNLGQYMRTVKIPGFLFDQSAYQKTDGHVRVFVETLPNTVEGAECGGMTDRNGREWGTGAYLLKSRVRTSAMPAEGCSACIKQSFSKEVVKMIGYKRDTCLSK